MLLTAIDGDTPGPENDSRPLFFLDWVKQAGAIKRTAGMEAMEHYVADQKAARRLGPE